MSQQEWSSKRSLPLLALGALGAQSVWSTEMAFASPFLLHLGMSKSNMAFVFIAGPLSGLLCQPIVGIVTDQSTNPWGRRRPALAIACILCAISMLILGFARPLASTITAKGPNQVSLTIAFVVFSIFAIDFSVNAVNALDRALILDLVDSKQQLLANVWSARLAGMGGIIGFFIGQIDLSQQIPFTWFPSLFAVNVDMDSSEAQLRCVCLVVVFLLLGTHTVTMVVAKELPARPTTTTSPYELFHRNRLGLLNLLLSSAIDTWTSLVNAARNLSRPILEVFRVHFFLSMAWFPVLFYSTSWVSNLARSNSPSMDAGAAMRLGSLAMLFHAILSVVVVIITPTLLQRYNLRNPHRNMDSFTALWSIAIASLAVVLLFTWLAEYCKSTKLAMTCIAITGFAWGLNSWAPYALLGILIQKGVEEAREQDPGYGSVSSTPIEVENGGHSGLPSDGESLQQSSPLMRRLTNAAMQREDYRKLNGNEQEQLSIDSGYIASEGDEESRPVWETLEGRRRARESPNQSGTISGLHNITVVLPHFIMTAITSIIFRLLNPSKQDQNETDTAEDFHRAASNFGLILRLVSVPACIASICAFRLARKYAVELEG